VFPARGLLILTTHVIGTGVHRCVPANVGQAVPPHDASLVTFLDLDFDPLFALQRPTGALQELQADQLDTVQSRLQQPPRQGRDSERVGHDVPPQLFRVRTLRARVCRPVCSQAAPQLPQVPQLFTTQFTGQHLVV
jgi:hypothetical protein